MNFKKFKKSIIAGVVSSGMIFSGLGGMVSNNRASARFLDEDYVIIKYEIKKQFDGKKTKWLESKALDLVDIMKEWSDIVIRKYSRTDLCYDIIAVILNDMSVLAGIKGKKGTICSKEIYDRYKELTDSRCYKYKDMDCKNYTSQLLLATFCGRALESQTEYTRFAPCARYIIRLCEIMLREMDMDTEFSKIKERLNCLLELIDAEYNVRIEEWERDNPELELKHWSDHK